MSAWFKGIIVAFITSAGGALAAYIADPDHFSTANPKHMAIMATVSGIVGVAAYLKQSPIPQE